MLLLMYFIRRGTDLKFGFLRPILAKIKINCQQPAMSQWGGVQRGKPVSSGAQERMAEPSRGVLGMYGFRTISNMFVFAHNRGCDTIYLKITFFHHHHTTHAFLLKSIVLHQLICSTACACHNSIGGDYCGPT